MKTLAKLPLVALAAFRLTYLIMFEEGPGDLARKFRAWMFGRFAPDHWVSRGFNCPFCVSFWMALVTAVLPEPFLLWLAGSELTRRLIEYDASQVGNFEDEEW